MTTTQLSSVVVAGRGKGKQRQARARDLHMYVTPDILTPYLSHSSPGRPSKLARISETAEQSYKASSSPTNQLPRTNGDFFLIFSSLSPRLTPEFKVSST